MRLFFTLTLLLFSYTGSAQVTGVIDNIKGAACIKCQTSSVLADISTNNRPIHSKRASNPSYSSIARQRKHPGQSGYRYFPGSSIWSDATGKLQVQSDIIAAGSSTGSMNPTALLERLPNYRSLVNQTIMFSASLDDDMSHECGPIKNTGIKSQLETIFSTHIVTPSKNSVGIPNKSSRSYLSTETTALITHEIAISAGSTTLLGYANSIRQPCCQKTDSQKNSCLGGYIV